MATKPDKIRKYTDCCAVCGLTMEAWAWKSQEVVLFLNMNESFNKNPLCSPTCYERYSINPLVYEDASRKRH